MTESELRQKVVGTAEKYKGCRKSDGSHKKIIDQYNGDKPLPRGYAVKYTDAYCATFVSAIAIECGLTDIMPKECGCGKMIDLYAKMGRWQEDDSYRPKPADVIFYDWEDSGIGDNKGSADHVGIVKSVDGNVIKVLEGNMSGGKVGERELQVNGRYIRGYGLPDFAKKATGSSVSQTSGSLSGSLNCSAEDVKKDPLKKYGLGDSVTFTGNMHYTSSYSRAAGKSAKPCQARVTNINLSGAHPYHVVGKSVHGWVDKEDIK